MWRRIRISVLLLALAVVALNAWSDRRRTTDWNDTLWIGLFPVNADDRDSTARYIAGLEAGDFHDIETFFGREAESWGVTGEAPVHVELYPAVTEAPPQLDPDAGLLGRVAWSLRARYFSWRVAGDRLADIRLFVLYHDPEYTDRVPHSLGLQKGLFGVVHAYASRDYDATNSVVVAHEFLHTLGATDKYDPVTTLPVYPAGYAQPEATPRLPQRFAEIMAGRIPLSPTEADMPDSLRQVVVGPQTAAEIRWIDGP